MFGICKRKSVKVYRLIAIKRITKGTAQMCKITCQAKWLLPVRLFTNSNAISKLTELTFNDGMTFKFLLKV